MGRENLALSAILTHILSVELFSQTPFGRAMLFTDMLIVGSGQIASNPDAIAEH